MAMLNVEAEKQHHANGSGRSASCRHLRSDIESDSWFANRVRFLSGLLEPLG